LKFLSVRSIVLPGGEGGGGIELEEKVGLVLGSLNEWFQANNLKLNLHKTSCLHVRRSHLSKHVWNFSKQNPILEKINVVKSHKFLGVILDENFSWNDHVDILQSKLKVKAYLFKKLKLYSDIKTLKIAYYSYVQSLLTYNLSVWGNTKKENITKNFKMQKRIIRIMAGVHRLTSCRPIFLNLNILTFPSLIIRENCITVRTNLEHLELYEQKYNTRGNEHKRINVKDYNTINPVAVRMYNNLPTNILTEVRLSAFKKKLEFFLLQKCFYCLDDFFTKCIFPHRNSFYYLDYNKVLTFH